MAERMAKAKADAEAIEAAARAAEEVERAARAVRAVRAAEAAAMTEAELTALRAKAVETWETVRADVARNALGNVVLDAAVVADESERVVDAAGKAWAEAWKVARETRGMSEASKVEAVNAAVNAALKATAEVCSTSGPALKTTSSPAGVEKKAGWWRRWTR